MTTIANACPGRPVLRVFGPDIEGERIEYQPHEPAALVGVDVVLHAIGGVQLRPGNMFMCKHCSCVYWEPDP